jgi:hypothetical protein
MAGPSALIDDMGIDDVGFLIENLGADASELQYLRELVQNGIESIQRAGRTSGRVEVDFEEVKGVRKLRITDNGTGMTPDEVRANINRLSASGGVQALDRNFGIGAKITAAVRNPHGVMYKTWKGGTGSLTVLGRQEGRYGRIGFQLDGSIHYWVPLIPEQRHEIIEDCGVSVVLLGRGDDDDTTIAPPGADLRSQWVSAYLERRYFDIPDGTTVRVLRPAEILDSELGERRPIYDTIRGQRYYLDKHSDASGRIELADASATVWWWILSDDIVRGGKTWNNRGHVGALFQGELHEVRGGHSRASALKDFGVYAGHARIVIYVEPLDVLKANTARTNLILRGNRPIDYVRIGSAFADRMPQELASFMAGQVTSETGDHRKAIRKVIQEVESELGDARFRGAATAPLGSFEPDIGGVSGADADAAASRSVARSTTSADATGRLGGEYFRQAREELERLRRAQPVDTDPTPIIKWVTGGDTLSGRAASYVPNRHLVTANLDFDGYRALVAWAVEEAKNRATGEIDDETARRIAEDEVRRWYEQALTEVVVVLRPLAHDARWGAKANDIGLSEEGLTAAVVSHRWHMMSAIRRGLAGRLGSRRTEAA